MVKYALWLSRADLRILTGLLTGHADLKRHLTLMQIQTDAVCPLCQEDEETVLHLLGECSALSALSAKSLSILGYTYLTYEKLGCMHWCALGDAANRMAVSQQRRDDQHRPRTAGEPCSGSSRSVAITSLPSGESSTVGTTSQLTDVSMSPGAYRSSYLLQLPAHVVQCVRHSDAMCSRSWRSQWPRIDSSLGPGASAY